MGYSHFIDSIPPRSVTRFCLTLALLIGFAVAATALPAAQLPDGELAEVGLPDDLVERIRPLIEQGIAAEKLPGCVVCVGRQGRIVLLEAFGNKQVVPEPVPMTTDTVFDLASLTKPVATATSIMKLIESGQLRLGTRVVDLIPEFGAHGKEAITIQDLLIHQSGLIPDNALADYQQGPEVAWDKICQLKLIAPVGSTFKYSDVNFIVLAEIIQRLTGSNVDQFSQAEIFAPLGMRETGFVPAESLARRAAPTQQRDGQWMRGEVHDPRADLLNGIAGHAGLFSTAGDLAVYAQMMLGGGTLELGAADSVRVLSPLTVAKMAAPYRVSSGLRGLGWDKQTGFSSNRGDLLSSEAFGHGGFTGTVLWIDPKLDLFFIFLSNRVHPDGKGSVNHLAGQILNAVVGSLDVTSGSASKSMAKSAVLTGIDVLVRDQFRQLRGRRVGLITNHTGRDQAGRSTVELLHQAPQVELATLFSPEHGFKGQLDVSKISDSQDATTGLKIYSLYGATRRPTAEMLSGIDTVVFDIQDVGARFYTYISTMGEAMQAAAEQQIKFVVLDRPNPINGRDIAGPMLDPDAESFVAFHRLPVRHGLTTGELALLLKTELSLELDLEVIRCEGWQRDDYWEATNLTWVNPSPNMRSLTQAILYPGIGLLELTNLSVGRGTDTPFEVIGAPWMDARQLAAELNARELPGVVFVPIEFTPTSSKHADTLCYGVNIAVTNRAELQPVRVGLEIAVCLRKLYPDAWEMKNFNRLLGNSQIYDAIVAGKPISDILPLAHEGLATFQRTRQQYLLYENSDQ